MTTKTTVNIFLLLLMLVSLTQYALADSGFVTSAGGVEYKDLKAGNGEIVEYGDIVTMHFTGWINNNGVKGKEIFNTRKQHKAVSFVVGTDKVMAGWSEGVIGMQAGGKRLLRVPPEMGYGARAIEDIVPANAHLIFIIDVVGVDKKY